MGFHDDYEQWLQLTDAAHCPVCHQVPMPEGMEDIAELPHSWLSAEPVDCLKGACHLIARRHAVELYELDAADLLAWMKEVQVCAKALKTVTGAVKINYEIHGNTVPHLHMHLYPRYRDDPFAGRAIEPREKANQYAAGEFEAFVAAMRREIERIWAGA